LSAVKDTSISGTFGLKIACDRQELWVRALLPNTTNVRDLYQTTTRSALQKVQGPYAGLQTHRQFGPRGLEATIKERVGNSRTDGCGTDDPKDDGFILVVKTKKNRRKDTVSCAEVVKAPAAMKRQDVSKKNKVVSGSLSQNNRCVSDV
jgi:hypothetical protein